MQKFSPGVSWHAPRPTYKSYYIQKLVANYLQSQIILLHSLLPAWYRYEVHGLAGVHRTDALVLNSQFVQEVAVIMENLRSERCPCILIEHKELRTLDINILKGHTPASPALVSPTNG
jgi:hypothetical protein